MNMYKITISNLFFQFVLITTVAAQNLNAYQKDTAKVMQLKAQADRYRFTNPDSCLPVAQKALQLAQSLKFKKGEGEVHLTLGEYHRASGNFPEALQHFFTSLRISREIKDIAMEGSSLTFIGIAYIGLEEFRTALNYLFQANEINRNRPEVNITAFGLTNIGVAYQQLGMLDSALIYQNLGWQVGKNMRMKPGIAFMLRETGIIYALQHKYDSALYYFRSALTVSKDVLNAGRIYSRMALLYEEMNNPDSAYHYARLAFSRGQLSLQKLTMLEAGRLLARYFMGKRQLDSVIKYQELNMSLQDSLFGRKQIQKLQLLAIEEQKRIYDTEQRQKQIEQEQTEYRNNIRMYVLLGILAMFLLLGFILYRNNRRKQIANKLLEKQKNETEKTLKVLQDTQAQLIQSEKMASLGELTAGIAHEIQNPLNFVNNFSEVNKELLAEMKDEMDKGNIAGANEIANDVIANEEKINHHGKRAGDIVRGMIQHSRSSSGVKEPTDINALADEYLRLAYHGLRTKDSRNPADKSLSAGQAGFNATIKTDFDTSLEKINIIPQDIGRVILNLLNNAFYAVNEKQKQNLPGYEPTVTIRTTQNPPTGGGRGAEIRVTDNGNGIPQKILDKIFQPFFTTKPTGQGTGLGLSLSYDIVKAHGGELKVETKEGEGSTFIMILSAIY
ncbi:MAG: ATP-binding protein [Bacteroidota bacterium]|nr:ATP-binding protein [Bacteroidota bacterium]